MRSKIHWLSIALAYSSLFLLGLSDNLRGPLFPEVLADLHLSDSRGSLLWAMASFFGIVGSAWTGWFSKRYGMLSVLQVALLLMSLGQFAMGASQSYAWALVSCFIFGFSLGILGVVQNLLVLQSGPPELLPQLQSGLHSNYALSSLLAPVFLSLIHYFHPSWRAGYLGGGTLAAIGFLVVCFVPADRLQTTATSASKVSEGKDDKGIRRQAVYVGLILALYVLTEIMISSRLALFLRREMSLTFDQTNLATTAFFIFMFIGRFALVFWRPRVKVRIQLILSLIFTLGLSIGGLCYSPLLLIPTGLTMAPFFPLAMAYLQERLPNNLSYAMTIAMSLVGLFVVSMHILVGLFSDSLGITMALALGPVALIACLVLLLFDRRALE